MGTINYGTSDYITMGIKPYDSYDLENDKVFMEEMQAEVDEYGGTLEQSIQNYISTCYEADLENLETEMRKHSFYYFHISIEYGYYEGFYLKIENNFGIAYNDYMEKREAQKEITEIKAFLEEIAGFGFVSCYPGWCMRYADYKGTLNDIKAAIKEMRAESKATPTWRQYNAA